MLTSAIEQARQICEEALQQPALIEVAEALKSQGMSSSDGVALTRAVTESSTSLGPIKSLKSSVAQSGLPTEDNSVEQFLLVQSALSSLDKLPDWPVSASVKKLICEEFAFYARPDDAERGKFRADKSTFVAMSKIATLRRFPAGQFDWEVSGLPRSRLFKVNPLELPRVLYHVAAKLKGFSPAFFSHLNARRKNKSLSEEEANKSYYRMAKSLELQSEMKGFVACSWFRSPDTQRVSPHLAWLSKVFLENGGLVTTAGPADPESGIFHRSATRKKLYEAGEFKPTNGLVIWPRAAMLTWAAEHPEFADRDQ
jgi:hypothetical protein